MPALPAVNPATPGVNAEKGPDYVYFQRNPTQYGEQVTGKAMAAKMRLELFYKEAVEGVVGRKERWV
jgi:protein-serine/threonine kinase